VAKLTSAGPLDVGSGRERREAETGRIADGAAHGERRCSRLVEGKRQRVAQQKIDAAPSGTAGCGIDLLQHGVVLYGKACEQGLRRRVANRMVHHLEHVARLTHQLGDRAADTRPFLQRGKALACGLQDCRGGRRTAAAMPDAGGAIAWCLDAGVTSLRIAGGFDSGVLRDRRGRRTDTETAASGI
jgi:hypothetical protein